MPTALLVTGDDALSRGVKKTFGSDGRLELQVVREYEAIYDRLGGGDFALLLAHAPGKEAVEQIRDLLRHLALLPRPVPTIVIGEEYNAEDALALLRLGAADYLERPLDIRRLAYLADTLTAGARARASSPPSPVSASTVVIESEGAFLYNTQAAMGQLMRQVRRVAPQDTNLLLLGETGTGKTRLARVIHELSPRHREPFVTVHCGSLSSTLIESEIFGHVRGAFTGATRNRVGKLAEAGRGTIFLDDIDALPLDLQTKLLQVVEDRVFEAVGDNRVVPLRARVITATNRNLEQEVEAGRFRSDLYYRLNVVGFYLPPLRDRLDSLPSLVTRFVGEYTAQTGGPKRMVAPEVMDALMGYNWPGNIRELRNVIQRAVVLCEGDQIVLEDLPPAFPRPTRPVPLARPAQPSQAETLAETKEKAEATLISAALVRNKNNRARTAAELGISRMTLYKKLHRYGLLTAGT